MVEVVLVRGRMRSHEVVLVNEFLVSKETVVLRRWERSKQKQVRMAERSKALRSGRSLRMEASVRVPLLTRFNEVISC